MCRIAPEGAVPRRLPRRTSVTAQTLPFREKCCGVGCPPLGPAPPKPSPLRGKVSRRTPRRMRGLPFPVPLFREGRGKPRPYGVTGNSPYLIGPDTPSGRAHKDGGRTMCAPTNWPKASRRGGFQPPEKPSPLQGEGVTAHAATDEGSSFPRPAFSRRAGQAPPLRSDWKQPVPHRARYPIGPRPQRRRAHNVRPYELAEGIP